MSAADLTARVRRLDELFRGLAREIKGKAIKYREWDVNPLKKGVNRGPERIRRSGHQSPRHRRKKLAVSCPDSSHLWIALLRPVRTVNDDRAYCKNHRSLSYAARQRRRSRCDG